MGSCQASDTLTVPVILSEKLGRDVQIIACPIVAHSTILDLQTAITGFLGSLDVFHGLSYRGSRAQLTSRLDSFVSGGSSAPRFQADYAKAISAEVKTSDGKQLHHLFRADIMVQDAEEQIKAALGGNSLEGHCLFVAQGDGLTSQPATNTLTTKSEALPADMKRLMWGALLSSSGVQSGAMLHFLPYNGQDDVQIFMKDLTGKTLTFDVDLDEDVAVLEARVTEVTGIPAIYQRLIHRGEQLQAGCTLESCHVTRASFITLTLRLRGGGAAFADVSNTGAMTKLGFSTDGPRWRYCSTGLNVEGICNNPACEAHEEMIIDMKGLSSFNLLADKASCPICHEAVKPITAAFVGCAWMYDGCKLGSDGQPECCHSSWQTASHDGYHRFKEEGNTVDWESLVISARETKFATDAPCPICWSQISSHKGYLTGCRHGFHKACLAAWQKFSEGAGCPLCRDTLAAVV